MDFFVREGIEGVGINPTLGFTGHDLSFLRSLDRVKGVVVVSPAKQLDLSVLSELSSLEFLWISDNETVPPLSSFPQLREYRGDWHRRLGLAESMSALRSLHLRGFRSKSRSLVELPTLPRLEALELVRAKISSTEGVGRFAQLEQLELAYCRSLESLSGVEKLSKLRELSVESCRILSNYGELSKLSSLTTFVLVKAGDLDSVAFAKQLDNLERFCLIETKVVDGDMTPLGGISNVDYDSFPHYVHASDGLREVSSLLLEPWGEMESEEDFVESIIRLDGRDVTVSLSVDRDFGQLTQTELQKVSHLATSLESLCAEIYAWIGEHVEDDSIALYISHHLDAIDDWSELVEPGEAVTAETLVAALHIVAVHVSVDGSDVSLVLDFSLGEGLTQYVLAVSVDAEGQVSSVDMES